MADAEVFKRRGLLGKFRTMFGLAWRAYKMRDQYDVVVADFDHVGASLAFLLKLRRSKAKVVTICHGKLSRGFGSRAVRLLRLHKNIQHFVCYGKVVADRLHERAGVPKEQIHWVLHPADQLFWKSAGIEPERLISSAGGLRRDYPVLVDAIRDLDVSAELAAFSPWVNPDHPELSIEPADNVKFTRLSPSKLRDLYDRSAFVVVPLIPNASQAGSLVIYEAMAMGKAIIVAGTVGQLGLGIVQEGVTGFSYPPGDTSALKQKIDWLLNNPDIALAAGAKARVTVDEYLNLDHYVDEFVNIVDPDHLHQRGDATT